MSVPDFSWWDDWSRLEREMVELYARRNERPQPPEQAAIEAAVQRDEARWRQSLAMRVALGVRSERGAAFAARALVCAFDLRGER